MVGGLLWGCSLFSLAFFFGFFVFFDKIVSAILDFGFRGFLLAFTTTVVPVFAGATVALLAWTLVALGT